MDMDTYLPQEHSLHQEDSISVNINGYRPFPPNSHDLQLLPLYIHECRLSLEISAISPKSQLLIPQTFHGKSYGGQNYGK